MRAIVLCVALGALAGFGAAEQLGPIPLKDSETLKETRVTVDPDAPIDLQTNTIYCGAFQLAWNELRDSVVKADLKVEGAPAIVDVFNRRPFDAGMISPDAYVAMAGVAKDGILEKVNAALRAKFAENAPTVTASFVSPEDLFAYAYLARDLDFPVPFDRLERPLAFMSGGKRERETIVKVRAFGLPEFRHEVPSHQALAKQVTVLFYDEVEPPAEAQFAIELDTGHPSDELVLAVVTPGKTLRETVEAVQKHPRLTGRQANPGGGESLQIPEIALTVRHSLDELVGKSLLNAPSGSPTFGVALQDIQFSMDERGASLKAAAKFEVYAGMSRSFVFYRPFLVWLRQRGAEWPYLVLWVATPELMTPVG